MGTDDAQHATNLLVASLDEDHLQAMIANDIHNATSDLDAFDNHGTVAQQVQLQVIEFVAFVFDVVLLLDQVSAADQPSCQSAILSHHQQSMRHLIQAAADGQFSIQLDEASSRAFARFRLTADDTNRFVEQDSNEVAPRVHLSLVEVDPLRGPDLAAQLIDNDAVDAHLPGPNIVVGFTTRADPFRGQRLVQSHQ